MLARALFLRQADPPLYDYLLYDYLLYDYLLYDYLLYDYLPPARGHLEKESFFPRVFFP